MIDSGDDSMVFFADEAGGRGQGSAPGVDGRASGLAVFGRMEDKARPCRRALPAGEVVQAAHLRRGATASDEGRAIVDQVRAMAGEILVGEEARCGTGIR